MRISKDDWPNARRKERRQARLVDQALAAGRTVVVDNTNPGALERGPLVAAARRHAVTAVAVLLQSTVAASLARNSRRQGRARVPDVAIYDVAGRLQSPTLEEGFDQRWLAQLTPDGVRLDPATDDDGPA